MPTSQTQKTPASSTNQPISTREIAYYNRRLQNAVFNEIVRAFVEEVKAGRISRATLAKRIGKEPPQITRWLSGPSNLTLDTISTILLGMNAVLDAKVVFSRDISVPNYAHPLVDILESVMPPDLSQTVDQIVTLEEVSHPKIPSSSKETETASLLLQA